MERQQQSEYQEQDRQQYSPLSSSDFTLVPFVPVRDEWILSNDFLVSVYDTLQEAKLLNYVFWNDELFSTWNFIDFCQNPNNQLAFVFKEKECAGFAWLTGISGSYCFGHFCFFPDVWGRTEEIARLYLNYWFSWPGDNGPLLDTIIGIVPGFNDRAHKFVQRVGFEYLGTIPQMLKNKQNDREDAVIFYLSRQKHGKGRRRQSGGTSGGGPVATGTAVNQSD